MTLRFQWVNLICKAISKMVTGLIYLSFFLVQFDIHLSGSTQDISFFSSDYSSINNGRQALYPRHSGLAKDSRHHGLKLNKRFHPKHLFIAPISSMAEVEMVFQIYSTPIHTGECPTDLLFNSPSRRGPPIVV